MSIFLESSFNSRVSSSYQWETLFAGYRWETTVEHFRVRNRIYLVALGVWNSRDPSKAWDVNLTGYVKQRPTRYRDPSGLDLFKEYSRGGDDEDRTYETARIRVSIWTLGNCTGDCRDNCKGTLRVFLAYQAHLTGCFLGGPNFNYGIFADPADWTSFAYTPPPPPGKPTIGNLGWLNADKYLGTVPCKGGSINDWLYVGTTPNFENISAFTKQTIRIKLRVEPCGSLSGDVDVVELPLEEGGIGPGGFVNPLKCVSCGEAPYPPATPASCKVD